MEIECNAKRAIRWWAPGSFKIRSFKISTGNIHIIFTCLFLFPDSVLAQASNAEKSICADVGYYRICGNIQTYRKRLSQFGDILDFDAIEASAFQQTSAAIKKKAPDAVIKTIVASDPLAMQWNRMVNDEVGSFAFSAGSLQKFPWYEKLGLGFATGFEAVRRNIVLMEVDLNGYPEFLNVKKSEISQLCKSTFRKKFDYKAYSPSQRDKVYENCYQLVTGNLELAWSESEPKAKKGVYYLFVSMWASQLMADQLINHILSDSRLVYYVESKKSLSPRVDSMGNLYLSSKFYSETVGLDLELVMLHEAGHVQYFTLERLTQILFLSLPKFLEEEDAKEVEEKMLLVRQLLQTQGLMMEFNVDASVLIKLFDNPSKRHRYQKVISKFEKFYPEREQAINLMNRLADSIDNPDYLTIAQHITDFEDKAILDSFLSESEQDIVWEYNEVIARFYSALSAGKLYGAIYQLDKTKKRVDPMLLEEQIFQAYMDSLDEFRRMARR